TDRHHIRRIGEASYFFQEVDLMANVEKRERLIEKQITATRSRHTVAPQLGQHAREVYALALAAAERLIVALAEFSYIEVLHDFVDDRFVGCSGTPNEMRVTSHHHDLTHRQWKRDLDRLRKHRTTFRELGFTRAAHVDP